MRRNISIENEQVNSMLNSLQKGSRSNYIEQSILLKMNFDSGKFVDRQLVYSLINDVLKYMNVNGNINVPVGTLDVTRVDDTLKQSIINILKM